MGPSAHQCETPAFLLTVTSQEAAVLSLTTAWWPAAACVGVGRVHAGRAPAAADAARPNSSQYRTTRERGGNTATRRSVGGTQTGTRFPSR